ncbi:hypothetical protein DMB66_53360 [Actinoplanes sp. ATCC 53533]|uniref:hypothetical protein n=1 Tax=Actinoplanes sp. ATCC 53533 TaxID=1288362 RepID=UPI000F7698C4|nr:hypothetical protein [Actinoplanes sp. ATCC 53533]RSM43450.1 hypothetical protein DMB66_53360 [Actinoplanes sp. ATCC 53533]
MTSNDTPPGAAGLGIWANLGIWIAFGAAFGVLVDSVFGTAGLGIALGPALGVAAWAVFIAPRRNARGES